MMRTFRYPLLPTVAQEKTMATWLRLPPSESSAGGPPTLDGLRAEGSGGTPLGEGEPSGRYDDTRERPGTGRII